jgi:hypothetical protein
MKDKMEHKIQDLLQNQDLPYNSAAWDKMKQVLDAKMPVNKPTNWYKWFMGGAAITVIAVSTYFFIQKDSSNSTQSTSSPKIEKQIQPANQEKVSTTQNTSEKSNLSPVTSISTEKTDLSQTDNKLTASTNDDVTKMTSILEQSILVEEVVIDQTDLDPISSKKEITDIVTTNQKEELTTNSTLITAVNMCLGERQLLENKNDFAVSVFKQNSNQLIATIEAKKSMSFEAKEQGTYLLVEKNKPVIEGANSFEVKNSPKPTLEIENEIRYEKGVPTLKASTDATNSVQWTINNLELNSTKSELDFNPFKAGTYSVSVKTLTEGCIVSQTSKVNVDEDYNLLAVNAFNPNSFEPRNQTFIPFALTQRDVKFTLLILDPKDGGVMYQTEDASQPWNGIDKRTGQLAPSNQAYIWKVRIANPLPGESTEYKGTITKL